MNILSLFDGMSCWQIALERAWISVDNYYSSEIDKYATAVTQYHYPNTIQLWDVIGWRSRDLPNIDLIMGGSPCQWFSFAGKQLAFDDPRSKLFFTMVDIIKHYKPKYFLLENVRMKKEYQDIITEYMWVEPIVINSNLVSAQNRLRYYRTNIPWIEQPEDKNILLKDIIAKEVDKKYYLSNEVYQKLKKYESNSRLSPLDGKSYCLNTMQWWHRQPKIKAVALRNRWQWKKPECNKTQKANSMTTVQADSVVGDWVIRKLAPNECERLQTAARDYQQVWPARRGSHAAVAGLPSWSIRWASGDPIPVLPGGEGVRTNGEQVSPSRYYHWQYWE